MYRPRELLAYGTLSLFLVFVLSVSLLGSSPEGGRGVWGTLKAFGSHPGQDSSDPSIPDFSHYRELRTLSAKEFPLDDPTRNVIVVGDIHGMSRPFRKLLQKVDYSPSRDVLVHVGDTITKGPLEGSLDVLKFLSANNITGVRGNHEQKVLEWRGWLEWITSLPGGRQWLQRLERKWEETQSREEDADLDFWIEEQRCKSSSSEKKWWKHVPKGWTPLGGHYTVAKDMSKKDYQYLLALPLRLHVPSAHVFIVHAGVLPSDPRYPVDDKSRQPLARMPTLLGHNLGVDMDSADIERLRNMQELEILKKIIPNTKPWVTLNMRSVLRGEVTKDNRPGTPWAKMWNNQMKSCVGFKKHLWEEDAAEDISSGHIEARMKGKHYSLPCYPSTTIYGHAATRNLDINRWSFGLDSGCVYEDKLTAIVLSGSETKANDSERAEHADEDEEVGMSRRKKKQHVFPFGDNGKAKLVAVKCRPQ